MSCQGRRRRIALFGLLLASAGCESTAFRQPEPAVAFRPSAGQLRGEQAGGQPVLSPKAGPQQPDPQETRPQGSRPQGSHPQGLGRTGTSGGTARAVVSADGSAPAGHGQPAGGVILASATHVPPDSAAVRSPEEGARSPEEVPAPAPAALELLPPPIGTYREDASATEALPLAAVIESIYRAFPEVAEAAAVQATARGEELAAWGLFDTVVEASSINQPLDYYENYRHAVGVTRPLWSGGAVSAGYRIGRGDFEPWYGNRATKEGGEFMVGFAQPLLQGHRIDPRRVAVRTAALRRQAADPNFRAAVLGAQRAAARAYWGWVQAGFAVRVQRELLGLGRERVRQLATQIEAGELGRIAGIDNARLIAQREAALIQAERELQVAAVNLSIYLRDAGGMPLVPPLEWLPEEYPEAAAPQQAALRDGVARAPLNRPEPRALQIEAAALRVELAGAVNQILPELDAAIEASQDVGGRAKTFDDKAEFKLVAGVEGSLPVQRRVGRGKAAALEGKVRQNRAKAQLVADKITAQAREAAARLIASWEQIERAERNLELAQQARELGRLAFAEGDIDLLLLNIYEQSVADAQLQLYGAKAAYFAALAEFQVATGEGLSPLEGKLAEPSPEPADSVTADASAE